LVAGITWFVIGRGSRNDQLVLYGNVDIRAVTLGFRVAGRVASVAVDEGDAVTAGQELARLDTVPLQLTADEAAASAASLAARARLLKDGFRPEDVQQAQAAVVERRATLANAEQQLARQQALRGTGAVAARVYDDAVATRDQARARLTSAEAAFAEMRRGYRAQEVAEAVANEARAAATAAQARQHVFDAVLRAPGAGVVTTRAVEPGTIVAAGTPVLTLTLPSPVWVRIYVGESDLGRVASGREVLIYTDSRSDRPYHGRIGFVSPTAEFTPKNVETADLRTALVYRARVVVSDADQGLRQGMPVTVRISDGPVGAARP
jgi:HlyD family secretion protein